MPTVRAIIDHLDSVAPWARAAAWDPVGLQVGDPAADVTRVGVCHDVTPLVIEAAVGYGVDLLVAYHPLLFDPVRRFVADTTGSGLAFAAARAGMAVATVHTAFDVVPGGSADALADAIGLTDVTPFAPLWARGTLKITTFVPQGSVDAVTAAMASAGAGTIGAYTGCSFRAEGMGTFTPGPGAAPAVGTVGVPTATPEVRVEMVVAPERVDAAVTALVAAHPYEEPAYDVVERRSESGSLGRMGVLAGDLAELVGAVSAGCGGAIRVAGERDRRIQRVAVVPGSGSSLIASARGAGADALVTGDVKHHDARAALAAGLAIIDPGHAATERPGLARLYAALAAGPVETIDLTGVDADPWTM